MDRMSKAEITRAIAVVNEVSGGRELSEAALTVMARGLEKYPREQLARAFERCTQECKGHVALADIILRIDDGRPSAEEAWTRMPFDEDDSAWMTDEMRACFEFTQGRDLIAGRVAFVKAYNRAVQQARAAGTPVGWQFSGGGNLEQRLERIREGVQRGLISLEKARKWDARVDPEYVDEVPEQLVAAMQRKVLMEGPKPLSEICQEAQDLAAGKITPEEAVQRAMDSNPYFAKQKGLPAGNVTVLKGKAGE